MRVVQWYDKNDGKHTGHFHQWIVIRDTLKAVVEENGYIDIVSYNEISFSTEPNTTT